MAPTERRMPVPGYVLIVDFFCMIFAVIGFTMAFRQRVARRWIGRPQAKSAMTSAGGGDPITYILRISGTMIMVFGVAIGGMVTLFNLL